MEYLKSTHHAKWLISKEQIEQRRAAAFQAGKDEMRSVALERGSTLPNFEPSEEDAFINHHLKVLLTYVRLQKIPLKVLYAAVSFVKRFYLDRSIWRYAVDSIVPAALVLACKTEESAIHPQMIADHFKIPKADILKAELDLMSGINFHLLVYSPFRSLHGFKMDLESVGISYPPQFWDHCSYVLCDLIITDASLMFPPQLCALAAIFFTSNKSPIVLGYLQQRVGPDALDEFLRELQTAVLMIPSPDKEAGRSYSIEEITEKVMEYRSVARGY